MRLPPRRLSLISFLGELALAALGGRLAWSTFHRGDLFVALFLGALSALALSLGLRYLREYRG